MSALQFAGFPPSGRGGAGPSLGLQRPAVPWDARHNRGQPRADPAPTAMTPTPSVPARDSDFETTVSPLWLRAQAGDDVAYRQALAAIARRVRAYLRRRLQSTPDEVEDLVQEVLLALHVQRGTWNEATSVEAWVLAITRYKLVDLWRRRGRQEALHDPIDDVAEAALAAPESDASAGRDLARLLEALPAAQREAILLTKVEGLSVSEACERTGASESALKVQVHRGLKRLAALVRKEP